MIPNPETIAIEDLIAHRGRMKLIGEMLAFNSQRAATRSIASRKWPLAGENSVNPLILLELVAQTAGICNGWKLAQESGRITAARGWLVGVKIAEFFVDEIPFGAEIIATAQNDFEFEGFREIKGEAFIADKIAARVILQVIQA
jgi:predicted hotdog family 3-hydroxylacyl-ACP dehydratase